jgi:alkylation response protein AidB-like acyl-CoA dehydrogenase
MQVFGKPLIEQPVIRAKIGAMCADLQAVSSWLENITYQMTQLSYKQQAQVRFTCDTRICTRIRIFQSADNALHSLTFAHAFDPIFHSRVPPTQLLAGPIALLKYQATRVQLRVADNAVQIFGGRGITRTGMGHKVCARYSLLDTCYCFIAARV